MSAVPDAERDLLQAVLEALSLPFEAAFYDQRLNDRAGFARVVIRDALAEAAERPDAFTWNADWLRRKLREEEARHSAGEQR
ncbi:hypothetical protein ACIP6X_02330 [Streptomyces coeruleorubidus]|uniref:hypothetical protein n=1 Tax=Streptomyces coeruleorubidus TaxID=116188 RepID=UPI003817D68D